MSLDTYAAAAGSELTSQFTHSIPSSSEWCQSRRQARFYPAGSNVYGPSGTRVCRIPLTADGWIDPYSVHFHQTANSGAADVVQANFAPCFWQRARVFCGGVLCEDIQDYNRLYWTMAKLGPQAHLDDMRIPSKYAGNTVTTTAGSQKQSFPLWTGLLSQHRALPARSMNMSIELECVSDGLEAANNNGWSLTNCFITADIMDLDTALQSSYASALLKEGKSIHIPFTAMQQSSYTVSDSNWQVAISRSVSRLKALFLTFKAGDKKKCVDLNYPSVPANDNLTIQCQLGARQFPETRAEGVSEIFPRLLEAAGNHTSVMSTTAIDVANDKYTDDQFIAGISFQRLIADSGDGALSGLTTKQGDLLTVRTTGINQGATAPAVNEAFVTIAHDALLVVSEEGVQIMT